MTFTRTGDTLKRAEPEGSFTYKRCAITVASEAAPSGRSPRLE